MSYVVMSTKLSAAKNKLKRFTVVHEVDGNEFSVEDLLLAVNIENKKGTCKQEYCRLTALQNGNCYLHGLLEKRFEIAKKKRQQILRDKNGS